MIAIIETDAELEALAPEWDALWRATAAAAPFQSPHWLLPWWRRFGTGMPRVATLRHGGRLAGLLPLYVLPDERKALPIGAGTTDYLDALGDPAGLLPAMLDRLQAAPVDLLDLIDVPPGSRLDPRPSPGWRLEHQSASACPVLPLLAISASTRRNLNLARNRCDRAGGWAVETADQCSIATSLALLIALHQSRWTAQGQPGELSSRDVTAFWSEAAPALLTAGLLRLQILRIGGQPAAAMAALLAPGRIFLYLGGFDPAFTSCSPGSVLLAAILEQAFAEGRTEAHFLRGQERYKYAWGATDRLSRAWRYARERPQR